MVPKKGTSLTIYLICKFFLILQAQFFLYLRFVLQFQPILLLRQRSWPGSPLRRMPIHLRNLLLTRKFLSKLSTSWPQSLATRGILIRQLASSPKNRKMTKLLPFHRTGFPFLRMRRTNQLPPISTDSMTLV